MNPNDPHLLTFSGSRMPAWLARGLVAVIGVLAAIAGFFFLTIVLVAGAFVLMVLGVRWWWALRRLRAEHAAAGPLEGEYRVLTEAEARQRID